MSHHTNYFDLINLDGFQDNQQGLHLRLRFVNDQQSFHRGDVGLKSPYFDTYGKRLHVGDLVRVTDKETNKSNDNFVIYTENQGHEPVSVKNYFTIMGYATISTDPLKIINGDYLIKVIKPYTELKHGDRHDMIHALMVDNEVHPETNYLTPYPERIAPLNRYLIKGMNTGINYGAVGTKTMFADCYGLPLYVGDIVQVFDEKNNMIHRGYVGEVTWDGFYASREVFKKFVVLGFNEDGRTEDLIEVKNQRIERCIGFEHVDLNCTASGYMTALIQDAPKLTYVKQKPNPIMEEMKKLFEKT